MAVAVMMNVDVGVDGIGGGGGDGDAIRKLMWYSGESGGREQLTIVRFAKK